MSPTSHSQTARAPEDRQTPPNGSPGPLFYATPEALTAERHAGAGVKPGLGFARRANAIPLVADEFFDAQANYPIVFGLKPEPAAFALVGLADGRNLFVGADGGWLASRYVPAYVRRYPFIFAHDVEAGRYTLCVDAAALTSDGSGVALFEGGAPSRHTQDALAFCKACQSGFERTKAFATALNEAGLLAERSAEIEIQGPDGPRSQRLNGLLVIDEARFDALPDDVFLEWRRRGWIALAHAHLMSQRRWGLLIELSAGAAAGEGVSPPP